MKKIIQKLFILAAALFAVSCNGDLNISQDNKLSASNMWKDANDVTTSTKGIYYLLRKISRTGTPVSSIGPRQELEITCGVLRR